MIRRWRGGVPAALAASCLLLLTAAGAARAGCGSPELSGGLGSARSRWDETGPQGQRLLRESGTLTDSRLALALACGDWSVEAQRDRRHGSRDYDGLSSRGTPVSTRSDIAEDGWRATLLWRASPAWQLGLRGETRELHRTLVSVGDVLGYAERHRHAALALGIQGERDAFIADWQWRAGLWLGGGRDGSVDIDLPGADPVRLRTGAQRFAELELALRGPLPARGWRSQFALVVRNERIAAGPSSALWRNGVLVGAASQPQQRLQDVVLRTDLSYRF